MPRPWSMLLLASLLPDLGLPGTKAASPESRPPARVETADGLYWTRLGRAEEPAPIPADLQIGDGARVSRRGSALGKFRDQSSFKMLALTAMSFGAVEGTTNRFLVFLRSGGLYLADRGIERRITCATPYLEIGPTGTEYVVHVDPEKGETEVLMLDGEAELRRDGEVRRLERGFRCVAAPGRPLVIQPIEATRVVQWWIHYPAVLDPAELESAGPLFRTAIEAYRAGDFRRAIEAFPGDLHADPPDDRAGAALQGALLLAAGWPGKADELLAGMDPDAPAPGALRALVAAVSEPLGRTDAPPARAPRTASEWLADSYRHQSNRNLDAALRAARMAVRLSPEFGLGWARAGELAFSHGDLRAAREATTRALALAPRLVTARALHGFLLAADHRVAAAESVFDEVIRDDPMLADGWLGRGLCRIRRGDPVAGREDLRTAAGLDPRRSLLRAYAGKAFDDEGDTALATKELAQAAQLDPRDPVPPLYSALQARRENRLNDAITHLQYSLDLNDNRAVYRSPFLLDQDRAVRGANLAVLYAEVGLQAFAERAATRAVNADYANPAAHLFLANSYDARRDPRQIHLRYETPWLSESLVGNLLAPVGATALSPTLSRNEYSALFERDGLRFASETQWTSQGDWLQHAAQAGQYGRFAYALDARYRSETGARPNADFEQLALTATVREQLGAADGLLIQATTATTRSGDVIPRYDPAKADPDLRIDEDAAPLAAIGWNHEWQPGHHTLLLVSPWQDTLTLRSADWRTPFYALDATGGLSFIDRDAATPLTEYRSRFTGVSTELLQVTRVASHTLLAGARFQAGEFDARARIDSPDLATWVPAYGQASAAVAHFDRIGTYVYDQWQIMPAVLLTAGVGYDRLTQPVNFRHYPVSDREEALDRFSPKVGLTVTPWAGASVRAAFARSLGGVSFDQSYRLEPVQVAGFNQAYRSLLPEAVTGAVGGQEFETWGFGLDQWFPTRTVLTLALGRQRSEARTHVGALQDDFGNGDPADHRLLDRTLRLNHDLVERTLDVSAGQLLGRDVALSAGYHLAAVRLESRLPEVPVALLSPPPPEESQWQEVTLAARYQNPVGFFARWESRWTCQSDLRGAAPHPGMDFWQHNTWVGWRWWRRHAEVAVGLLNLTDQDYRLDPLSLPTEPNRERTVVVSGKFAF